MKERPILVDGRNLIEEQKVSSSEVSEDEGSRGFGHAARDH